MSVILVSSDLSSNADAALVYAIRLNEVLKWKIILFHNSHISAKKLIGLDETASAKVISEDERNKKQQLQSQIDRVGGLSGTTNLEFIIESNNLVVDSILEVAAHRKATLIIMGAHGESGLTEFVFGSNTSEIISKSEIPILAIPGNNTYRLPDKILFSTDLHDFKSELSQIQIFSEALKAPIHVLYLDYGPGRTGDRLEKAEQLLNANTYKDILLIRKDATIERTLIDQIIDEVKKHDPGWLVMFTRPQTFWDKLFHKSKTQKLAYTLHCPLLSIRKAI